MRRILILGAGASKDAGYPLASDLLSEMERQEGRSSSWKEWKASLDSLPKELEVIRSCTNPEVALSLVDLFDIAADQQDDHRMSAAWKDIEEKGAFSRDGLQHYYESPSRLVATEMRKGLARLRTALDSFFGFRHADDYRGRSPRSRDHLRRRLENLSRGDAVLTFNWDTLAERTLQEDGRWSPCDGYGFQRKLEIDLPRQARGPYMPIAPSEVLVLKLHGSFGWRQLPKTFFLDQGSFLDHFEFRLGTSTSLVRLRDTAQPSTYQLSDSVLMYPSFLKKLDQPVVQEIWSRAARYLDEGEHVEVIGYSLPKSDSAARTLLLPLGLRCRAGKVKVVVRDPCSAALDRWRELLGEGAGAEYSEEPA